MPSKRDPPVTKVLCTFFVQEADGLRPARKTIASCRDHPKIWQWEGINPEQCRWSQGATLGVGLDKTEENPDREAEDILCRMTGTQPIPQPSQGVGTMLETSVHRAIRADWQGLHVLGCGVRSLATREIFAALSDQARQGGLAQVRQAAGSPIVELSMAAAVE